MKLRDIKEITKWPPDWASAYGKGDTFPIGDSKGTFTSALMRGKDLEIHMEYENRDCQGTVMSKDERLLKRICDTINKHKGDRQEE